MLSCGVFEVLQDVIFTQYCWAAASDFKQHFGHLLYHQEYTNKPRESFHPNLYFNKFVVEKVQTQKHLGLKLDKKSSFKEHLKDKFAKVNKGIGILKKLSALLPRHLLITLCKSFIQLHLDYADIIYDQPNNLNLCNKIETCQYNAALAILPVRLEVPRGKDVPGTRFRVFKFLKVVKKIMHFL